MTEPTILGTYGKAWAIKNDKPGSPRDWQATLACFLVQRPGAHPFWDQWVIAACHLRDIPGVKSANKQFPTAEHEIIIMALDPERHPIPDPDAREFHHLEPLDLVWQCDGLTDKQVNEIVWLMVDMIVKGGVSPDSDFRRYWIDSLNATRKHYIEGVHE